MWGSKRNQPVELEPLGGKEKHPAPTGTGNDVARDGFERLSETDPFTGRRQPVGGRPVYPRFRGDD